MSSKTTILRTVYAFDPVTENPLSTGLTLVTDGNGGTNWIGIMSSLTFYGGPSIGNLPSTISSFSSLAYTANLNFAGLSSMSTDIYTAISSLGFAITNALPAGAANNSLVSSSASLGSLGYISSPSLTSSLTGAGLTAYRSTLSSTTSTVNALGDLGYVSTASLTSSLIGLGSLGYVSSPIGTVLTATQLTSSIVGLGTTGYVSTLSLPSTVAGLGTFYVSTPVITSTVAGLGSGGYISTSALISSIAGLGTCGYISTSALVSTTIALSSQKANIRFDTTGAVIVNGQNTIAFNNVANIIYISSFLQSSISYTGPATGLQTNAQSINNDLIFSTAQIDFASFAAFMNSTSRVTVDVYPSIAFSKLGTGAAGPVVLPISTMVQYGGILLSTPIVTSFLYAGNTTVTLGNMSIVDASNFYTTPIKLSFPPSSIVGQTANPYTLVHLMPSSLQYGVYQNALHSAVYTPYFSRTGSIFVSVQNIPTN